MTRSRGRPQLPERFPGLITAHPGRLDVPTIDDAGTGLGVPSQHNAHVLVPSGVELLLGPGLTPDPPVVIRRCPWRQTWGEARH